MLPFEEKEPLIIEREKAKTDKKFGCFPSERTIQQLLHYGIINIDKPKGPSSHQVTSYVRDILQVKQCGHSGTLDPRVTGVLPIATDKATRVVEVLLTAGKSYVGVMKIHKEVTDEELETVRKKFLGSITQLPPVRSAVKRARRKRRVYDFTFLEREGKNILFKVDCQAGTYIRKLVHDLGQKIGGAHMAELRRTQAGSFKEDTLVSLHDLKDAMVYWKEENNETELRKIVIPMEAAVAHLPKVWVRDSAVDSLCHGADLNVPGIVKFHDTIHEGSRVAIMTLKEELIGYGDADLSAENLHSKKGKAVTLNRVFMQPGVYPAQKRDEVQSDANK